MVVRTPGIAGATDSTEAAADGTGELVSAGTGQLDGARSSVSGPAGTLPTTGSDLWWPLGIAAVLLLLGAALCRRAS